MAIILGKNPQPGDVVSHFGKLLRITKVAPYEGPLNEHLSDDAQLARFGLKRDEVARFWEVEVEEVWDE